MKTYTLPLSMSKRTPLNVVYKHQLPVYSPTLPDVVSYNPLSWLSFAYAYLSTSTVVNVTTVVYRDGLFLVHKESDILSLWRDGFFGKGVFSRSEPSWFDRTQKRLGIGEFKNLTMEEITAIRRDERKKFKQERAKLEAKQAELKKQGVADPFIEERLNLKTLRDQDINVRIERQTHVRDEDGAIVKDGELIQIETLQLQAEEAFFLKFALNSVIVQHDDRELSASELFNKLSSGTVDDRFISNYVVYHHYRSLGWCVRSGIKFGTDYLLYKRGPPFHHAEFAVIVLPNYKDEAKNQQVAKDFVWMSSLSRVVGGVRKNLVIAYVDVPTQEDFDTNKDDIVSLLKLYSVNEVIYKRWVANKNRD